MRLVLLCGGSGSRLRPLSNSLRSKLFLDLLPSNNGGRESMIARIRRQLDDAGLLSSAVFVTHREQTGILRGRIGGERPIIIEPERRGTFLAAVLAASYCRTVLGDGPDETICLMPADPFVDERYFRCIASLPSVLERTGAALALIGTAPHAPTDQYGYIVPTSVIPAGGWGSVAQFVEKPNREAADALIRQGALWNCGVFAFKLRYLLDQMTARGIPDDYAVLQRMYRSLEADSFDREIVEREPDTIVVRHDGIWKDLGSWNAFTTELNAYVVGLGSVSADSSGTHVVNELHIPLHVIGVSGIIAAAGPDGILVADKRQSDRVKAIDAFPPPMHAEDETGTRRVLYTDSLASGESRAAALIRLKPGASRCISAANGIMTAITVLSGSGRLIRGSEAALPLTKGDAVSLPMDTDCMLEASANAELEFIEVQIGTSSHRVQENN